MPRPNPPRTIVDEQGLADRLAYEREAAGMSYEGLASRMTSMGCPIHASALYKVEKGTPPRKLQASELIAIAKIFEVTVEEFCMPVELVRGGSEKVVRDLWNRIQLCQRQEQIHRHELMLAWQELEDYGRKYPGARAYLARIQEEQEG